LEISLTYASSRVITLQVTCITTSDLLTGHEAITAIGGATFYTSKQEAIRNIESRTHSYYTSVNGKRAEVGVREGANGKFLQTYADGYWNNNFLALGQCR
jgi:hypothetical protein